MRACIAFLLLFLVACGGKEKPPSGPLDREKFEQVMMESLLIEARLKEELAVDKREDGPTSALYDEMFKKQGVTKADFRATYDAYLKQPEELKAVYQDVLNDLQQRADSVAH